MSHKVWGVLLTDAGLTELHGALNRYLRKGSIGQYLYCKSVELSGTFARLVVESVDQSPAFVAELYVPYHYIKFVVAAAEFKQVGFA